MSKKERELPEPGKTPFSKKRFAEDTGQENLLMADEMTLAAAEGKLDEYLEQEMPGGEYAKKLALMMMGMTGLLPPEGGLPVNAVDPGSSSESAETTKTEEHVSGEDVPPDVLHAVQSGDVDKLKELLAREQQRRDPGSAGQPMAERPAQPQPQSKTAIEKDMLETLVRIASENSLSIDWLVARALKLYIEEFQKTGRL